MSATAITHSNDASTVLNVYANDLLQRLSDATRGVLCSEMKIFGRAASPNSQRTDERIFPEALLDGVRPADASLKRTGIVSGASLKGLLGTNIDE